MISKSFPKITKYPLFKTFSIFKGNSILHAYSNRLGGQSKSPFDALNLGLHTSDEKVYVKENRRLFFKTLNIDQNKLVFPQQTHSDHVAVVEKAGAVSDTDALVSSVPGLVLTIQTADCFPVFICHQFGLFAIPSVST